MARASIHNSGQGAVDELVALIKAQGHGAAKGPRSGKNAAIKPDVLFGHVDGRAIPLEVKQASSSVPQLRPVAYKVTVVRARPGVVRGWYVIPPDDLMRMAANHPGQHCVNSFECMNPGAPSQDWNRWHCEDREVVKRIIDAYEQGEVSPLKAQAQLFRTQVEALYEEQKTSIQDR